MEHLDELYKRKRELYDMYQNSILLSTRPNIYNTNNEIYDRIREEISYLEQRIQHEKEISLNDAFISRRLQTVVNENPEHFLDMINPKDIEKYLRKKKLEQIKKPSKF